MDDVLHATAAYVEIKTARIDMQQSALITPSSARLLLYTFDVVGLPDRLASLVESRSAVIFEHNSCMVVFGALLSE